MRASCLVRAIAALVLVGWMAAPRPAIAQTAGCGSWLPFPALAAGGAVAGGLGSTSLVYAFNEERAFSFPSSVLIASGATIGLIATYAGLTPECALANGDNGWRIAVPITSLILSAAIPIVVWLLSPKNPPESG